MPPTIGAVLSHDKSLIGPLTSTLGLEDLYDLLEVITIDGENDRLIAAEVRRNE